VTEIAVVRGHFGRAELHPGASLVNRKIRVALLFPSAHHG